MRSEIDVLAYRESDQELWVTEVKTRQDFRYSHPSHAVRWQKRHIMLRVGEWLLDHWTHYLEWWKQHPLINLSSPYQKTTWHSPHSLGFPKSARFAIISVFANQIDCIDASDW